MSDELILGVDGGGTKCIAWIAAKNDPRRILGRGIAGPANPQAVGPDIARDNLQRAIDAAFDDAKRPAQRFAAACFGLAGIDRESDRQIIERWSTERKLTDSLHVVNDAIPVLFAADQNGCGIAVIAGTGSFAFGQRADGKTVRAGGWGYLFGDEGSAYDIAVAGLRAAAKAADGRGPRTILLENILVALGRQEPSDLISALYDPGMTRANIAALSPVVFAAAESGDSLAAEILSIAVIDMADMVSAVATGLNFLRTPFPLAFTGGVLLHHAELGERLREELRRRGLSPVPIVSITDPVAGALVIAAQIADGQHE